MNTPIIFNIKRGSIDDGNGIRTVLFFKGCPLNCLWCHNPGGISPVGSGGRVYEIQELISIIAGDEMYYKVSGGGVTFSGGEPTLFMDYVGRLAKGLHGNKISCALQTCGYFKFNEFKAQLLPYLDCVMYDIKLADSGEHIKYTGKDNKLILENLRRLTAENIRIIPRTPLIPGITDTEENLTAVSKILSELGLKEKHIRLEYNEISELLRTEIPEY